MSVRAQSSREERRRQERLQRRKPRGLQRAIPAAYAASTQLEVLGLVSLAPISEQERNALALPAYTQMQSLSRGGMDIAGYYELSRTIVVGFYLCQELMRTAKPAHRATLDQHHQRYEDARLVMRNIADRFNRTGVFGASGPDLQGLRDAMEVFHAHLGIAEKRHTMAAERRTGYSMKELYRIQAESVAQNQIV